MKYWIYQDNQVKGPYDRAQIQQLKGFEADSLVCPEGRKGTDISDWQRASTVPELSLLMPSKGPTTALMGPEESPLRDAVEDLKRKVEDFEDRLERMQQKLDEHPATADPIESKAAAPAENLEMMGKLEEIDDKLVALSSLDSEFRKLKERVEQLEERAIAVPAAPTGTPAPLPELSVVQVPPAKAPSFEPIDFKVETFEKQQPQAPLGSPALTPSPAQPLDPLALTPPPVVEPFVLAPPPMPAASSVLEAAPGLSPSPAPAPALTPLPMSLGTPLPESSNPFAAPPPFPSSPSFPGPSPFPTTGSTPLAEFVMPQQPTPFPSLVPESGLGRFKPPEALKPQTGAVDLVSPETRAARGGKKTVIFLFVIILVVGGGLLASFYHDLSRFAKGGATNVGMIPTTPTSAIKGLKEVSAGSGPDSIPDIPPADYSQSAVDLVKAYSTPGGRQTLGDQLESTFPSKGGLSPWMVEPLVGQNKYQVTFYVGTHAMYVFLVEPKNKKVEGVNTEAKNLLLGESPKPRPATPAKKARATSKPPAAKPRHVAKPRKTAAKARSDTMIVAPQEKAKAPDNGIDDLLKDDSSKGQ